MVASYNILFALFNLVETRIIAAASPMHASYSVFRINHIVRSGTAQVAAQFPLWGAKFITTHIIQTFICGEL